MTRFTPPRRGFLVSMNRTTELSGFTLHVEDGEGREWSEENCPESFWPFIEDSLAKGRTSGTIAAAGRLFRWRVLLAKTTVIEFTRGGKVVERIEVSATGWAAFRQVAARRGVAPESLLTMILGAAMAEGLEVQQALEWLFPGDAETDTAQILTNVEAGV